MLLETRERGPPPPPPPTGRPSVIPHLIIVCLVAKPLNSRLVASCMTSRPLACVQTSPISFAFPREAKEIGDVYTQASAPHYPLLRTILDD